MVILIQLFPHFRYSCRASFRFQLNSHRYRNNATNQTFSISFSYVSVSGIGNSMMMDANNGASLGPLGGNSNQSFYSNLAPSAIGGQAIVTSPLLLSQPSNVGSSISSIGSAPSGLTHSIYSTSVVSSSSIASSAAKSNVRHATTASASAIAATVGKKFTCKMCSQVNCEFKLVSSTLKSCTDLIHLSMQMY
jgi:hypothetical protein